MKYNETVQAYVDPAAIGLLAETEKRIHRDNFNSMTLMAAHIILEQGLIQRTNDHGTLAEVNLLLIWLGGRRRLVAAPMSMVDHANEVPPPVYTWLNKESCRQLSPPEYLAVPMSPADQQLFFEKQGLNIGVNQQRLRQTGIALAPISMAQHDALLDYVQALSPPPDSIWD